MDIESIKKDYLEIVACHKSLIKINKDKIPKYYGNLYDDIDDDVLNGYEKGGLLYIKYWKVYQ